MSISCYLLAPPMLDQVRKIRYPIRGLLPPLGLLYLAAVLQKQGYDVTVIDAQALGWDFETTVQHIVTLSPSLLGITVLSPFSQTATRIVEQVKALAPDIFTVMGGAHPTVLPEKTFSESPSLDAVVLGEGEPGILDLIRYLDSGVNPPPSSGILLRGQSLASVTPGEVADLDALPFPARDLVCLSHYAPEPYGNRSLPSVNIIASRGCTWSKCTYCIRAGGIKRPFRVQSVARTLDEMTRLVKDSGVKEFVFYDEDLFSSPPWLHELCDALLTANLRITWTCRGRSDTIDEDLIRHAKAAGLFSIFIGLESGNQDLLDLISKGITLEQSSRAIAICNRYKVETVGSFMLALPGETPEQGDATINFAKTVGCTYASFQPTYPSEGTPLQAQCTEAGWFYEPRYGSRIRGAKFLPEIRYVPKAYETRAAVARKVRKAYREFYLRPGFCWGRLKSVRTTKDLTRMLHGVAFILGLIK